jgi:hypothetical protein
LQSCLDNSGVAPAAANPTASYLTETSTSYEKGAAASSSDESPTALPKAHTEQTQADPTLQQPSTQPAFAHTEQTQSQLKQPGAQPESQVLATSGNNPPAPARTPSGQTIVGGQTFAPVPANGGSSGGGQSVNNKPSPAQSATVIGGKTFTPVAATPNAPSIVVAGATFAPIITAAGAAPVFNIGGQTLGIGSTIVVGSGTAAETVVLKTDGQGHTVLVAGTSSSTLVASGSGLGDYIAGGLGGSKTSGSGVAMQTTNDAPQANNLRLLSMVLGMVVVLALG